MELGSFDGNLSLPLVLRKSRGTGKAVLRLSKNGKGGGWIIKSLEGDRYFRAVLYETIILPENFKIIREFIEMLGYSDFYIHLEFSKYHKMYPKIPVTKFHLSNNRLRIQRIEFFKNLRAYVNRTDRPIERPVTLKSGPPEKFSWFINTQPNLPALDSIAVIDNASATAGLSIGLPDKAAELAKTRDRMALRRLTKSPAFNTKIRNKRISSVP